MFHHALSRGRFPQSRTVQWLAWLAWQMRHHGQTIFYIERMQPDWLPHRQRWLPTHGVSLMIGLTVGIIIGVYGEVIFGIIFGLLIGILGGYRAEITPVESLRWSWAKVRVKRKQLMMTGIGAALVFGIGSGIALGLFGGIALGLFSGPIVGLTAACLGVLSYALGLGLTNTELETKMVPNQGIRRSAWNGLAAGLVSAISFGLVLGTVFTLTFHSDLGVVAGLFTGFIVFIIVALDHGGRTCLQHFTLRSLLIFNGSMPTGYVRFLDEATSRLFLRKVGGGYIFIHRLLLDYFESRYDGLEMLETHHSNTSNELS